MAASPRVLVDPMTSTYAHAFLATVGHSSHGVLLPPTRYTAFVTAPYNRQQHCCRRRTSRRSTCLFGGAAATLTNDGLASGGDGQPQHPEQRAGFRPPSPLVDDGHVVDLSSLQDLLDSGECPHQLLYTHTHTHIYTTVTVAFCSTALFVCFRLSDVALQS